VRALLRLVVRFKGAADMQALATLAAEVSRCVAEEDAVDLVRPRPAPPAPPPSPPLGEGCQKGGESPPRSLVAARAPALLRRPTFLAPPPASSQTL